MGKVRKDCAFFKEGRVKSCDMCRALKKMDCIGCEFRKTKEQLKKEHEAAIKRIEKVYGTKFESFMDLKGYTLMQKIYREVMKD